MGVKQVLVEIVASTVFIPVFLHIKELDHVLEYTIDCSCILVYGNKRLYIHSTIQASFTLNSGD